MKTKRSVVAIVSAVSMAAFANFEWPDTTETPEPVIPSGETVEVTDAAVIDAYTSVTIDEGATLKLATATPPTTTLKGSGTIEKTGSQVWTMATQQTGFKGSYYVKAGVITNALAYTFGYGEASSGAVKIYIDGGTLVVAANAIARIFSYEKIYIAGTGVDNMGALVSLRGTTDTYVYKGGITLTADATIALNAYFWPRANINLNSHTLTFAGTGTGDIYYGGSCKFAGPGDVRVAQNGGSRTLSLRPTSATMTAFTESDPLTRVILEPNVTMSLYLDDGSSAPGKPDLECTAPIKARIHVDGGLSYLYHNHRKGYPTNEFYHTKPVTWAGPITYKDAASELCIYSGGKYCEQKLAGNISGPGKLRIGRSTSNLNAGRVTLADPTNSYTGCTRAYLGENASLGLAYSNSVPNYSAFTCWTGRVSLELADGEARWNSNAVIRLANEATWLGGAFLSFDAIGTEAEEARTYSTEGGWLAAITNSATRLSAEHGATLKVYGPVSQTNVSGFVIQPGGSIVFTGDEKIELGGFAQRGYTSGDCTVTFDGASNVETTSNGLSVATAFPCTMYVTNGTSIMMPAAASETWTSDGKTLSNVGKYSIRLGCASGIEGVLEMDATSFISNRVVVGSTSGSAGAVYQRGSTAFVTSGTYGDSYGSFPQIGGGSQGYWEVSENGKLVLKCRPMIGYNAPGILHIDGGSTVSFQYNEKSPTTQPWLYLSYNKPGVAYVKDGTLDMTDAYPIIGQSSGWRATITLDGPNAKFKTTGAWNVGWSTAGGGRLYINMNDGLFESTHIARRTTKVPTRTNPDIIYLNFNGGTFKSTVDAPFPELRTPTNNYWFVATVYGGGVTFDTDAVSGGTTVRIPLKGATGNGIASVTLPAAIADRTFAAPPYVRITGDGEGATAYAIFDSKTRKVTGVRVTSPGINYTEATAEFVLNTTVLASEECTLAANVSGDFTKAGRYTLTLSGTNTWGGNTILAGGTLKCGVDHALPATTTFVMAGGLLDLNGKTLSDDSTAPSKWGVDLDQVRDSGTVTYTGNINFPAGATIEVIGGETLTDADARSMTLLRMTGTVTGEPTITGVTDPRWNASFQSGVLKLRRFTGSMFSIR